MTWAPSHGQQSEDESVGEESSRLGAGYDEDVQGAIYEIVEDGHEDGEAMVEGPPKSELVRYSNGACGVADVCQ